MFSQYGSWVEGVVVHAGVDELGKLRVGCASPVRPHLVDNTRPPARVGHEDGVGIRYQLFQCSLVTVTGVSVTREQLVNVDRNGHVVKGHCVDPRRNVSHHPYMATWAFERVVAAVVVDGFVFAVFADRSLTLDTVLDGDASWFNLHLKHSSKKGGR